MAGPSSTIASLVVKMGLDPSGMSKGARQAESTMGGLGKSIAAGFGLGAGLGVFGLVTQAVGMVTDGIGDAIGMASDLAETQAKLDEVYEGSADTVRAWASTTDAAFVTTQNDLLASAATMGNFTQAMGASEAEAVKYGTTLTTLAADLASFNNLAGGANEAMVALQSGMAGETEAARRLGIDLRVSRLEADLVAKGIQKTNGAYTSAQLVAARYEAIMKDTAKAQGDVARTSGGLANQLRHLDTQVAELQTGIGQGLIPVAIAVVGAFNGIAKAIMGESGVSEAVRFVTEDIRGMDAALQASAEELAKRGDLYGTVFDDILDGAHAAREAAADLGLLPGFAGLRAAIAAVNVENMKLAPELRKSTAWIEQYVKEAQNAGLTTEQMAAGFRKLNAGIPVFQRIGQAVGAAGDAIAAEAARDAAAFKDWTATIRQGFGSVKAALQNPPMLISRKERIENLETRTRKVMRNIAKSIKADDPISRGYWRDALVTVQGRMERMRGTAHVKSGAVARDFQTTWGKVKSDAITATTGASAAISSMSADATAWGIALGSNYAAGIASQAGAVAAASGALADAAAGPIKTESPPKMGPLRDIEKWGPELVTLWTNPMLKRTRDVEKVGEALGRAMRPRMGPMGSGDGPEWERLSRASVGALAAEGVRPRREVHLHIGTLIASPGGLDELDRRMGNRRRHRERGAGRRANDPD